MNKKRVLSFLLAVLMLTSVLPLFTASAEQSDGVVTDAPVESDKTQSESVADGLSGLSYFEYLDKYKDADTQVDEVKIDVLNFVGSESVVAETIKDDDGVSHDSVKLATGGYVEWTFTVSKSGLYNMKTLFLPIVDKPINAEVRIYIDGVTPFTEATAVTFGRLWKDEYDEDAELNEYGHKTDMSGNDLSPDTVEVSRWKEYIVHDNDYMTDADLLFYFEQGEHTVRFASHREAVAFAGLSLIPAQKKLSYDEYLAQHNDAAKYSGDAIRYEAENTLERSERNLTMLADCASASTTPSHYSQIRLNTIGGENWNKVGQWISWQVEVEKDGLYSLSFKYIQNYVRGFKVYRSILVDGASPYTELESVAFSPNNDWENYTVSDKDGNPYYVYLTAGQKHTITLRASLGPLVDSLQSLQNCINKLNEDYLQIIAITGVSPDSLRDYDLDIEIPWLIDDFKQIHKDLNTISKNIASFNGGVSGGMSAFIDVMIKQLDTFIKNPLKITTSLAAYKSNISSLSDMLNDMTNQSLLLDSIFIGGETKLPNAEAGFWESLEFGINAFFASFVTDYNAYGNNYEDIGEDSEYVCDPISVWLASGRDQFNAIKTLVDDQFVSDYKIPVQMSLVPVGATLTQAILAGVGPDVCLMVTDDVPVGYSMRGALEDMDQFNSDTQYNEDGTRNFRYTFDEVKEWFHPSAFIAIKYFDEKCYGLPETQVFQMMFYREDVLNDLGIEPPETWDDLRASLTVIQRQNMNIGINEAGYATFLYQNGGSYYNEDLTKTNFNNQTAIEAFERYNSFYTDYDVPLAYDALNRFRSGEYPIIISNYSFYNNLAVGAPEIKGLWKMTKVPGTEREDGTISHAQASSGAVAIMIKGCENKYQAYDFMTWWVSASTQATYGNNIEARLGAGGRYTTANLEAFDALPWSYDDAAEIKEAWNDVTAIEKLPGDYYTTRMLANASRAVWYKNANCREVLIQYSKEIDKELQRKREQYKVDELIAKTKKEQAD